MTASAVTAVDALFILQFDVNMRGTAEQCPLPSNTLLLPACDVNDDSHCNPIDALFVLQCDVGLSNVLCPGTRSAVTETGGDRDQTQTATINAGSGSVKAGDTITIPITTSVPEGQLGAATVEIRYDPGVMKITGCAIDPNKRFDSETCNPDFDGDDVAPDVVRFNVLSASGVAGDLRLADLTFHATGQSGVVGALTVDTVVFVDPGGRTVPVDDVNGKVEIMPATSLIFLPSVSR